MAEEAVLRMGNVASTAVDETDRESFVGFYLLRYEPMVRLATLLVDEHAQAEEVAQDAFAKVYERWDRLEHPAAYLRSAVVNRSRDVLRRRRMARRLSLGRTREQAAPSEPMDDALRRLPLRQRTALVLRYYEDLPVDAIAAAMGTRPGTVKSLLHRGLGALREVIER